MKSRCPGKAMQKRVFTIWNEFSLDWLCVATLTRLGWKKIDCAKWVGMIKFKEHYCRAGVGNCLTRRATFEKFLKPRAGLIGRAKKRSTRPQMSYFFLLKSVKSKKVFGLIHSRTLYFCKRPRAAVCPPLV